MKSMVLTNSASRIESAGSKLSGSALGKKVRALLAQPKIAAIAIAVLAALAIGPLLFDIAQSWMIDPDMSHGPLVLLAAIWFARVISQQYGGRIGSNVTRRVLARGLTQLIVGGGIALFAWLLNIPLLGVLGWMLMLTGGVRIGTGIEGVKAYRFPILFLLFAAPLPQAWMQPITLGLQTLVSGGTEAALTMLGIANSRQGNLVQLTNYQLEVGAACSGLRQLTAMIALAAGIGFLSRRDRRFQFMLVLLAIPVALLANLLRAVMTALIVVNFGPTLAEGAWHSAEGLVVTSLATIMLTLIAVGLARNESERKRIVRVANSELTNGPSEPSVALSTRLGAIVAVIAGLAAAQWLLIWHTRQTLSAEQNFLQAPLANLPQDLAGWRGQDLPIKNPAWLYADQHVSRNYQNERTGQSAAVWLAYSAHGADRQHHPEICQTVAGKTEDSRVRQAVDLKDGLAPLQQYRFTGIEEAQRVLYWHYTFPSLAAQDWTFLQQLYYRTHVRPASLTVEVTAVENGPLQIEDLARQLDLAIRRDLVGPTARRGSDRIPVSLIEAN